MAQVFKGRRRWTGQITAMKFIMKHGKSEKDIRNLRQEIEILRTLKHENIIQMLDSFETREEFCVVTEFAQGTPTAHASEAFELPESSRCSSSQSQQWLLWCVHEPPAPCASSRALEPRLLGQQTAIQHAYVAPAVPQYPPTPCHSAQ